MMNRENKSGFYCFLLLFAVGCASSPGVDKVVSKATQFNVQQTSIELAQVNASGCREKGLADAEKKRDWKELSQLAGACASQKNWRIVDRTGQILSRLDLQNPWGPYYRSLAAEAQGERGRALWMINVALSRATDIGLLYYQKGRLLFAQNQKSEAVALFEKSVSLDGSNFAAHLVLGQIYFQNGETDRAKQAFQQATLIKPKDPQALVGFAECLAREKDYRGAADSLARVTEHNAKDSQLRLRRADLLSQTESGKSEAVELYRDLMADNKFLSAAERSRVEGRVKQLSSEIQKPSAAEKNESVERKLAAEKKGGS